MNSIQIGKQATLFLVISNTVCLNVRIVSIMDTDMNFQLRQQIFYCSARNNCTNNGEILARYLDEDAYLELRKCCKNGYRHWIGLINSGLCEYLAQYSNTDGLVAMYV